MWIYQVGESLSPAERQSEIVVLDNETIPNETGHDQDHPEVLDAHRLDSSRLLKKSRDGVKSTNSGKLARNFQLPDIEFTHHFLPLKEWLGAVATPTSLFHHPARAFPELIESLGIPKGSRF